MQMAEDAAANEVLVQMLTVERAKSAKLTGELALKETLTHGLLEQVINLSEQQHTRELQRYRASPCPTTPHHAPPRRSTPQLDRERKHSIKLSGEMAVRTGELEALREEVELRDRIETRLADAGVKGFISPVSAARKGFGGGSLGTAEEGRTVRTLVAQVEDLRTKLEAADAKAAAGGHNEGAQRPEGGAGEEGGAEGSGSQALTSREYEEIIMKMKDEVDELEEQLSEQKKLWSDMNLILSNENEELKRALGSKSEGTLPPSPMSKMKRGMGSWSSTLAGTAVGGRLFAGLGSDKGSGGGATS